MGRVCDSWKVKIVPSPVCVFDVSCSVLAVGCPVLDAGPGAVPHLHTLLAQHVSIFRQVLSLVELPDLADARLFPNDVVLRARNFLQRADNERHVREAVARHILVRDKGKREHTCTADHVILSNGARDASLAIQLQLRSELDGILVPSPDFTFAPSAALHGARVSRYCLEYVSQEAQWRLSTRELEAALARARAQVCVHCIAHSPASCRVHMLCNCRMLLAHMGRVRALAVFMDVIMHNPAFA